MVQFKGLCGHRSRHLKASQKALVIIPARVMVVWSRGVVVEG